MFVREVAMRGGPLAFTGTGTHAYERGHVSRNKQIGATVAAPASIDLSITPAVASAGHILTTHSLSRWVSNVF